MKQDELIKNDPKAKEISLGLAIVPMLIMTTLVSVMHLWLEVDLKFVLLLSTIGVGVTAYFLNYKLKSLFDDFADNIRKAFPVILILAMGILDLHDLQ